MRELLMANDRHAGVPGRMVVVGAGWEWGREHRLRRCAPPGLREATEDGGMGGPIG
jgi:hypothetical protein